MNMKRINHYELHFNSGDELKTLPFMKDDCEIVIQNLKTHYTAYRGEMIENHTYDSLDLLITADDHKYDGHNFDSLKAIKKIDLDTLCSIVVVYTDGSELLLHPTKNVTHIEKTKEDEYLHILYT